METTNNKKSSYMETTNNTPRYLDKYDERLFDKSRAAYFAVKDYRNEIHMVFHGHLPLDEYNSHYQQIKCMIDELDNVLRKLAKFYYTPNPFASICSDNDNYVQHFDND